MDRNALDWLFSTAPQAIAAFVGLIFAGVSFILGKIDDKIKEDPTLTEIYETIKIEMHVGLKKLLSITLISILLDFIFLFINPIGSDSEFVIDNKPRCIIVPAILLLFFNIYVISEAINYIKEIMDPQYFKKTVDSLLREYHDSNPLHNTVSVGKFMEDFIKLEKTIKTKYNNYIRTVGEENNNYRPERRLITVRDFAQKLNELQLINREVFLALMDLNRFRNLVAHGEIEQIEKDIDDRLNEMTEKLKNTEFPIS